MKNVLLVFLIFVSGSVYAQQSDDYSTNTPRHFARRMPANVVRSQPINEDYSQVTIVDSTQEIHADLHPYKTEPKIRDDRYYFWCLNNIIHATQGGFNGKLLNGHYVSFYPDKNLKEEGGFDRGLKEGVWKTWNTKGDLTAVVTWNQGLTVPDNQQPVWKKIPFFNKKDTQPQTSAPTGGN